ncbi:hypothetical protein ACFO1B_51580 [Dactylosporangium siamense]|uniref:Uncharacterized protein n=1 Tax=Dactylosporangium siamense TaxID=685454 RepID=A0A919U9V1_9ACTN|nr:hypothetical protein [Dactylosporangium siamense]GIG43736.1 hypothetical protein Dsi01nite_017770 [Dactylosporangium siamense]
MNTSFESQFRATITRSVEHLAPQLVDADELIRHGRSALRRRRAATVVAAAAALAAVLTVTAVAVGAGPSGQRHDPVASPGPTGTGQSDPTGTGQPGPTGTGQSDPTPTADPAPAGVDVLLTGNTIRTASGRLVTIPNPGGGTVTRATGVAGGWVVSSGGTTDLPSIEFLTDAGQLKGFQPALKGAQVGFAADGRSMGAQVGNDIYVFELPSLVVRHRVDVRPRAGGSQLEDLWLRGDRLVARFMTLGDSGPGFSGVVIWNLTTGTSTTSPDLDLRDVSADGKLALLATQQGFGPDATHCVSVVPIGDALSAAGKKVCGPGVSLTHGHFSPRGTWVAVSVSPTGTWLFRTTQLQAGNAEPVSRHDIDFGTWQDDAQLILADERASVVRRCPTTAEPCQRVAGEPEPLLGVITNHH